jgi:hypothetical protein
LLNLGKPQINAFDRNREPRHARISSGMVPDVVLGDCQSSAKIPLNTDKDRSSAQFEINTV